MTTVSFDSMRICASALLAVFCFAAVKRVNPNFDMPMRLVATVVFLGMTVTVASPVFSYISEMIAKTELEEWRGVLFGAVGIALLTHVTAELCRECGEGSIGGYVELVGKLEILILCLPLVQELLEEVKNLVA